MKNNKKILFPLMTLFLIVPVLWYFITQDDLQLIGATAGTNFELKTDDLVKIDDILNNILSLDLTAVHRTAPDSSDPPPYPRQTIRDPFQFGASPSLQLAKNSAEKTSSISRKINPMTSSKKTAEFDPQTLRISGIIYDRRRPATIIEDEVYFPGDSLKNFKILRITPDALVLSRRGKQYQLKVPEDE